MTPDPKLPDATQRLRVGLLSDRARLPERATERAAGYDLFSACQGTIAPRGRAVCWTDLAICVPDGTYGRVAARSGLATKRGIAVGAGVVDADYRGNVGVLLFNHSDAPFDFAVGDKIAQLVLERCATPDVQPVSLDEMTATPRGAGGFGSTDGGEHA